MPFLALNGIDLFYDDHPGPSDDAPVIVFLHGAGGNHLSWWQQVPHFRKQYRCVTIDHRSYGASTDPKDEGWARYGEDLVGLLDHLGLDRVALVAQSMGGRTALDTAVRVPDRISAVVMADTWGFFQWPENLDRDVRLREPLMADRVERGLPVMVAESFPERDPERMFLYQQMQALNAPLDQRSMDKNLRTGGPTKDEVAALTVPILFLGGTEDIVVSPEIVRATHEIIPGSEYREVPGCGHSTYWEDPETFNTLVGEFLEAHP